MSVHGLVSSGRGLRCRRRTRPVAIQSQRPSLCPVPRPEEPLATWIRMIRRTESRHAPSRIIAALDSIVG
ncbi:hypothetical protein F1734_22285 [Rhodococcus ruber]|nr:hypothetical protein F1734_22285 [Rhodococcus ruber]